MAPQPTRDSARTILTTAGIGAAAVLLAAAAAAPALADDHGHDGDGGNHYGQLKEHSNQGHQAGNDKSGSDDSSTSSDTASGDGHNPPGNNGTVFIHDVAGDHSPHNVPHVGCTFYVDFFGFDANQNVSVSFAGQAPTGKGTPLGGGQTLAPVSTDDAGGAGQDWDDEITVTADELGVSALGAPAHQGYHVKMTVVTNQPGDHKYKVFWVQPCTDTSTTDTQSGGSTTTTGTTTPAAPTTPTVTTPGSTSQGQHLGAVNASKSGESSGAVTGNTSEASSSVPTQVLGLHIARGAGSSSTAPAAAALPFTGAAIRGLAALAALLVTAGMVLVTAGRRRRRV